MTTNRERSWSVRSPADLGRAIAGVRAERRWTQVDLAAQTGIHRSYIAELERGGSTLVLERALRILRRMGATVTVTMPARHDDGEQ